jgi:hypothetical protein
MTLKQMNAQIIVLAAKQITLLLYPFPLVFIGLLAAKNRLKPDIAASYLPGWAILLSAVIAIPVFPTVKRLVREWNERRKAAKLGATFPVRWRGKSVGNMDILRSLVASYENGYLSEFLCYSLRFAGVNMTFSIGEQLWATMQEVGYTYEAYVLWNRDFITSDANIIKVSFTAKAHSF